MDNVKKQSKKTIKYIKKILKHQTKFNLSIAFFSSMMTVYLLLIEVRIKEQNKKIFDLNRKISDITGE